MGLLSWGHAYKPQMRKKEKLIEKLSGKVQIPKMLILPCHASKLVNRCDLCAREEKEIGKRYDNCTSVHFKYVLN